MTADILNEVTQLAGLQYTPAQVGEILCIDIDTVTEAMEDDNSPFYRAYKKGYYTADIAFRNSVKKLAEAGSSPAQHLFRQLMQDNENRTYYE